MKRGNYRVPVSEDGGVQHYPSRVRVPDETARWGYRMEDPAYRDNDPFQARLTIQGVESGRSAKYFWWKAEDGSTYPMFATDVVDLLRHGTIEDGGVVHAFWIVRKRGSNYGIEYHEGV